MEPKKTKMYEVQAPTTMYTVQTPRGPTAGYQDGLRSIRSIRIVFDMFDSIDSIFKKRQNFEKPLLKELSQSSQDSFKSESDSKESWDVWLHSPQPVFCCCVVSNIEPIESIEQIDQSTDRSNRSKVALCTLAS